MLSRVADAVLWLGRYVERAESVARFVDVNLYLELDRPDAAAAAWEPIIATTGDSALFRARHAAASRDAVLQFLVFDRTYASSVVSCLGAARENARSIREVISLEMWEAVNRAYLDVRSADEAAVLAAPHDFLAAVKQASHQCMGATHLTMTHNEAWHFARLGRLLERADKTSRIVDVKCFQLAPTVEGGAVPEHEIEWLALLRSNSAFEMYRKRHRRVTPRDVVDFLLFDAEFPRSIRSCLREAESSLAAVCRAQGRRADARLMPVERLTSLRAGWERTQVDDVLRSGLHETLDTLQTRLNAVGDALYQTFVAIAPS